MVLTLVGMRCPRVVSCVVLALLALAPPAAAQRDVFFDTLLPLYRALEGVYGDEGTQLTADVETLSTALARWDRALAATELQLRARLKNGDERTALEVHTVLATLYAERSRFRDALREIDEDLRIDPRRAVFFRFKALLHLAAGSPVQAADAFRAAWTVESGEPQNAYRLVVHRSPQTTERDIADALATLAEVERELISGERAPADSPFLTLDSINDDAGVGLAFVPAGYARAFSLLLAGEFDSGITALRAAVAADPLVADSLSRSEPGARGIAALKQGDVSAAIEHLELAVAGAPGSSEAHRMLGTAYAVNGDLAKSIQHLRAAVRLNPRDERSWLALARTVDTAGQLGEAVEILGEAVRTLPESGALRWVLSVTSGKRQRTDDADLELIAMADRFVMLAGRGELFGRIAALAQGHLEYDRAVTLLEQRVVATPNDAAAHQALGRAYVAQGREDEGYAELITALLLDPGDAETLTAVGRLHLAADRYDRAVAIMERAAALHPTSLQAVKGLGDALLRAGQTVYGHKHLEEAARLQARAVEEQRQRRTAGMLATQAELDMREGRHDQAIAAWQRVIELEGATAANHLRLAEALAGANRLDRAASLIEKAIALNAAPEAHRRLADVYAALGRSQESARERQVYVEQRLRRLRRP